MKMGDDVRFLKGIGQNKAKLYARIGVRTIGDLLTNFPRTYEDYSAVATITQLKPGIVSTRGYISRVSGRYVRRGMHITEAVISDATGSIKLVWFNQPYRASSLKTSKEYFVAGKMDLSYQKFTITNPSIELAGDMQLNTARILPIYRETKGLTSRQIRKAVKEALSAVECLTETLPQWILEKHKMLSYAESLQRIHFPDSQKDLQAAKQRLGFEEVFSLSLASIMNKREIMSEYAPPVPFSETVAKEFVAHLPFKLTDAQRKAIWQIYLDMQRSHPMNRLVEGDVGSGKTVVGAMAAVMVLHHGYQVALMAPTEILARQHAETLRRLLQPLGFHNNVGLLVGGMSASQKNTARFNIANGNITFIVGTHALIQESVDIRKLELVIIDEQHRFGVEQRKQLMAKAGHMPHVLNLTATPIPRSLALTLYGELDLSILDAKPAGRRPVKTEIISPTARSQLNELLKHQIKLGRQVFVVCPLITESDEADTSSVERIYNQMATRDFKLFRVGLLHGKMKPTEKQNIMQDFADHKLDVLVSTTVIEVGVDIPNASVMLIENAERFGLAQIHQLRGRVGRGDHPAYCYLMMGDANAPSTRLRALERTSDGFKLAELDLALRGPGAIYGTFQHGQLDLRIAKLSDVKLIVQSRKAAQEFIDKHENIAPYPSLATRIKKLRAVTSLN